MYLKIEGFLRLVASDIQGANNLINLSFNPMIVEFRFTDNLILFAISLLVISSVNKRIRSTNE